MIGYKPIMRGTHKVPRLLVGDDLPLQATRLIRTNRKGQFRQLRNADISEIFMGQWLRTNAFAAA